MKAKIITSALILAVIICFGCATSENLTAWWQAPAFTLAGIGFGYVLVKYVNRHAESFR